ncbi:MAG: metallophosphoesterase [Candidatus Aegiribacteria sp.]|nr:metallophosphoesterase [Candidatus Aegiribacteria sp.]
MQVSQVTSDPIKVYAISDLHLSLASEKPMDVFGDHWKDHHHLIETNWRQLITENDLVLLPGDLSWAMTLDEAAEDMNWLGELPGRKIITKGNHDYWWSSISQVRKKLPPGIIPLQHTAFDAGTAVITGTRGWITPLSDEYDEEKDEKIYRRELHRLGLALESAAKLRTEGKPLIVMLHYPPIVSGRGTEFSRMLSDGGADVCIYGHIHMSPGSWPEGLDIEIEGVKYLMVSADYLNFKPLELRIVNQ